MREDEGGHTVAFLVAVNAIVGGVEVEDEFLGWAFERSDELIDKYAAHPRQRLAGHAVLETAERGRGCQWRLLVRHALGQRLHHGIATEGVVIVEVFIAQCNAMDALRQQGLYVVDNLLRSARIGDAARQGLGQADLAIHLTKQQPAGVRGQPAAFEIRRDFASRKTGKSEW
jgi:hypothetical protein